jgi:hypothetical protein
MMKQLWLFLVLTSAALAQQWEVGGLAGGEFLPDTRVGGTNTAVSAGFHSGPAFGLTVTQDLYPRLSGEIRYLYEQSNARLRSGSVSASLSGQAHVVHYDLVYHYGAIRKTARPYVTAGFGIKIYRATGPEVAYRPLMEYAWLTRANEVKPMLSLGTGVKLRLQPHLLVRLDVHDQITRFPTKIIAPAPGMTLSGWLHDFVPTIGLSYVTAR